MQESVTDLIIVALTEYAFTFSIKKNVSEHAPNTIKIIAKIIYVSPLF